MKRIAADLAKSVYHVAESVRSGQVVQRKRLNREAFRRYIEEQAEPDEWLMEACGTAHNWGRVALSFLLYKARFDQYVFLSFSSVAFLNKIDLAIINYHLVKMI